MNFKNGTGFNIIQSVASFYREIRNNNSVSKINIYPTEKGNYWTKHFFINCLGYSNLV